MKFDIVVALFGSNFVKVFVALYVLKYGPKLLTSSSTK